MHLLRHIAALTTAAVLITGTAAANPGHFPAADGNVAAQVPVTGTVGGIQSGSVKVNGQDGRTIVANFGSETGNMNLGQTVWIYPSKLEIVDFPLEVSRKTKVGSGDFMKTTAKLSNTGILRARTRTWTSSCGDGFTGGVRVVLMDRNKNDLWISGLHKYGVNGTCVPGASSDRTEEWNETVPLDALNKAARIAIVHLKKPTNRVDEFLDNAQKVADILKTVAEAYGTASGGGGEGTGAGTGTGHGTGGPTEPTV
jgi:hypothetical protein